MESEEVPSLDVLVTLDPDEVPEYLGSTKEGLSTEEAKARLLSVGSNEMVKGRPPSVLSRALHLVADPFSLLLILAGALSVISGITELGIVIFVIVALNILLSVLQEWRVERVMLTLRDWLPQTSTVMRDDELRKVPASELVPGDVIHIEDGDRVPADARLIESYSLWTNNVPLTGESTPQPRTSEPTPGKEAHSTSPNLVFMGTSVSMGQGVAVVHATGMRTSFGKIATLTEEIRPAPSPLQREIDRAAKYDFVIALAVGASFFLLGDLFFHLDLLASLLLMIGVIVACVPEGLQLTISTALAISLLEMGKHNVLVKRLASVQTLGSVTVICTDKTGTITKGEMTVTRIWTEKRFIEVSGIGYSPEGRLTVDGKDLETADGSTLTRALECAVLCNNARLQQEGGRWTILGDPTEGALIVAAMKSGMDPPMIQEKRPRTGMLPFDPVRKSMTTFHREGDRGLACVKGAPDSVIPRCRSVLLRDGIVDLDQALAEECKRAVETMATDGLRVIAVAYLPMMAPVDEPVGDVTGLVLAGLFGMYDPPRPEVKESVRTSHAAGIRTIIITGDYGPTALAIAREVGLVEGTEPTVIDGSILDGTDDQHLRRMLMRRGLIFARVTPFHKRRIVKMLKEMGEVVAVTGDGANDAPSLKEADIGVAMGASGTDVAREASDMVLLDDSYSSIVTAVRMGRGIYDNVKKFLTYVFSHNWAELMPYILFGLLAIPLPLLAVQILAIDLIIDVPPSLALSREPPEPQVMERPPRSTTARLFDLNFLARSVILGAIIATGAMLGCFHVWMQGGWAFGASLPADSELYMRGTTMVFAGIVVAQMANLLGSRTLDTPFLRTKWTSNKWIYASLVWMAVVLMLFVYLPPFQSIFGTAPLYMGDWSILLVTAVAVLIADEAIKGVIRYRTRRIAVD